MHVAAHLRALEQHPFVARLLQHVDLTHDDLSSLNAVIDGEVSIPRRRDLIVDGFEYRKLSFVKDGYAVRYKLLRNGKRQILNVVLPGDIVGNPGQFPRPRRLFGDRRHRCHDDRVRARCLRVTGVHNSAWL